MSNTAKVLSLLTFTPTLASVLRASWQTGGDEAMPDAAERLVISLSGTINTNLAATQLSAVRVTVKGSGNLRDAASLSQNANIVDATLNGTWGDSSQPQFVVGHPIIALDYGNQPGLGVGDALLLRFNQPVAQVC